MELQPNNSLQFMPYEPEHHKYGRGASLDAVERHFETSSDLVLDLIGLGVPSSRRRALAFVALVAAAAAGSCDLEQVVCRLENGHRAVAEISGWSAAAEARARASFDDRRPQLRRVASALCRDARESTGDSFVDQWRRSIDELAASLAVTMATPFDVAFAVDNCTHMLFNRLGLGLADETMARALGRWAVADLRDEPAASWPGHAPEQDSSRRGWET